MRIPRTMQSLCDQGLIDEVIRPLLAGKEAEVYLVVAGGEVRVAKVYKQAMHRSFKHRAQYTEGRRGRNSRRERAIARRSKYGRREEEAAWRSAEVDAIQTLHAAGVRVPRPHLFVDGVLIMELITDAEGRPAPRLVDVQLTRDEALELFELLLAQVVEMLRAGLVHGDLSDFNVLLGEDGPVLIDFPQTVYAASNNNARKLLIRDVDNLQQFLARWAPELDQKKYGQELWSLYERGALRLDTELTGRFAHQGRVDTGRVLQEISAAEREERRRREAQGLDMPRSSRRSSRPKRKPAPRSTAPARSSRQELPDDLDALLLVED